MSSQLEDLLNKINDLRRQVEELARLEHGSSGGVTNGDSHDHNGGDGAPIPNAGLANSSVTIGSTSVSLGATAATVAGLTLTTPTIASFTSATHNHTNAAGGGQLDHGAALTGLGDDDHLQYHTDARGDARYVNITGDTIGGNLVVTGSITAASLDVDTGAITMEGSSSGQNTIDTVGTTWTFESIFDNILLQAGTNDANARDLTLRSGDTGASILLETSDYISFTPDGTERGRFDSGGLDVTGAITATTTITATTGLTTNGPLTLSPGGTQDYSVSDDGADAMTIQALGTGKSFDLRMFAQDADATDNVILTLWGRGKTGATADRERLIFGYLAATSAYEIQSEANGTGTLRPIIIYTEGNADQIKLDTNGRVGVGVASPTGKLHVDQASTTGAIPVLVLDQADLSEEMIEFVTTVGAGNPIDTAAIGTYYGKVRVNVSGVGYKYIALYNT